MTKEYSDLQWYLKFLCAYHAECVRMTEAKEQGRPVNARKDAFSALMLESTKKLYLQAKEEMGLGNELSFLTDTIDRPSLEFIIRNGKLEKGTKDIVFAETERFVSTFPDAFNLYLWEVGHLARALSDPAYIEEDLLYPYIKKDREKQKHVQDK